MVEDIYNPKKVIQILERHGKTSLYDDQGLATSALAKALKAEASDLLSTKLFGMMIETMRADAVEKGIELYTCPEHAMYAKAIWHVTKMMESLVKELSELKIQ